MQHETIRRYATSSRAWFGSPEELARLADELWGDELAYKVELTSGGITSTLSRSEFIGVSDHLLDSFSSVIIRPVGDHAGGDRVHLTREFIKVEGSGTDHGVRAARDTIGHFLRYHRRPFTVFAVRWWTLSPWVCGAMVAFVISWVQGAGGSPRVAVGAVGAVCFIAWLIALGVLPDFPSFGPVQFRTATRRVPSLERAWLRTSAAVTLLSSVTSLVYFV